MHQIPRPTAVARVAHEEPKALHTTAPPIAPDFEDGPHNGLAVRQNSNETCGYYTLPGTGNHLAFFYALRLEGRLEEWLADGNHPTPRWLGSLGLWCWRQL